MILPLRVFGSESVKRIASGRANLPISLSMCAASASFSSLPAFWPGLSVTKTTSAWPLSSSGLPDRRGLGDRRVAHERALDLGGADAVAGDVEHVVDAADDPEVAVLVAARAVAGEVHVRDHVPVRLEVALVVAPERARHRRPRPLDDELAALVRGARRRRGPSRRRCRRRRTAAPCSRASRRRRRGASSA